MPARFPAQDLVHGSSKIPSVTYYDENVTVRAIGAETLCAGVYERAQDEGWDKVEWFVQCGQSFLFMCLRV